MSFHITHRYGKMERSTCSAFPGLLRELDTNPEDKEHASVSVTHESEWCLEASRGGYLTFENLEEGDLDALESQPWQPGY